MPSPLRGSHVRSGTFEGKCCFSICRSACFLLGEGSLLCRFGTRHFGAKVPKAPGFRFPGPQNDSGLAPRPLPLSHLSFLLFFSTFDKGKISSIPHKVPAKMPSPRGEGGSKTRMRWRDGKTKMIFTKQTAAQSVSLKDTPTPQ